MSDFFSVIYSPKARDDLKDIYAGTESYRKLGALEKPENA